MRGIENRRPLLVTGNRVGLALMGADDVAMIAAWNQDLDFTARIGAPGEAHSIEERRKLFEENACLRSDSVEFAVVDIGNGRLVGFGGLFDITRALTATLFVGIGDVRDRGRGLGSEAVRLICEYGFFFRSLHAIKAEVHAYNRPALLLYERLGFKRAGRLRGVNLLNNRRYDEIIMDLVRDELELRNVAQFNALATADAEAKPVTAVSGSCRQENPITAPL